MGHKLINKLTMLIKTTTCEFSRLNPTGDVSKPYHRKTGPWAHQTLLTSEWYKPLAWGRRPWSQQHTTRWMHQGSQTHSISLSTAALNMPAWSAGLSGLPQWFFSSPWAPAWAVLPRRVLSPTNSASATLRCTYYHVKYEVWLRRYGC